MIKVIFKKSIFNEGEQTYLSKSFPSAHNKLITYNLLDVLNIVKGISLDKFEIIDLKMLRLINTLGKYHKNYFNGTECKGFPKSYISSDELFIDYLRGEGNRTESKTDADYKRFIELSKVLKSSAIKTGVWWHYKNIEIPFVISLHSLKRSGITIDQKKLHFCIRKIPETLSKIYFALEQKNFYGRQLTDLNIWIQGFGFHEYLPADKNSIQPSDLKLLADQHPVFELFKRLEKVKRAESLFQKLIDNKKIWPKFEPIGTVTDRCTSINPNIMGIPKIFRPVIIPCNENFGIVECDYAQMEIGVIASLAEDKNLIEDYNNKDVYRNVALKLFGSSGSKQRSQTKILFLGILYGLSIIKISKLIKHSIKETQNIWDCLFKRYKNLKFFLNNLEAVAIEKGYAESITSLRRLRFCKDTAPTYWERNWFKNFPVQASAAAVFKKAIINLNNRVDAESFHLLVPLYDSIVFEAPLDQLDQFTDIVCSSMIDSMKEFFPRLRPKVTVNKTYSHCWCHSGNAESIDEFFDNPLNGIDMGKGKAANVDWLKYL